MVEWLTTGPHGPALRGSVCPRCAAAAYPARQRCPRCHAAMAVRQLPMQGSVLVATVIHVRPPEGFPSPYAVGYVMLDGCGLAVPAALDLDAQQQPPAPGSRVCLQAGSNPGPAYRFICIGEVA